MSKTSAPALKDFSTSMMNADNAQKAPMSQLMENHASVTPPTKSTMTSPTPARADVSTISYGTTINVSVLLTTAIGIKDVENVLMDQLLVPTNLSAFAIMLLLTLTLRSIPALSVLLDLFLTEIEVDVLAQMDST